MDVLTVSQVAKLLSLSEITVYRLANTQKIPGRKVGRSWRFSRQAIEKWLSQGYSWEDELDTLLKEMQEFAKAKGLTQKDIRRAIQEVRQKRA